ncbi:MAG TPA: DUF2851 family protein [Chloroflexota bacterium]|nr:DUF2851 family protein [Chloroflexota bacterium]
MPAATHQSQPRARRNERWLADIWQRQSFGRHSLLTTSGLSFKVVFPGLCTGQAGPDFRDAILALNDGSLLRGDVELHLDSSGWRQHGHDRDAAYDRVLLHVVLQDDEPVRNSSGDPILTLELAGRLGPRRTPAAPPRALHEPTPQLSYVVAPCRNVLPRLGAEAVGANLTQLGLERFQAKQAAFEGELAEFQPDQALYAGLLEALGYSRNRVPFRQLAAEVPLSALTGARTAADIEHLLLARARVWHIAGVRPDNLPERRVRQFAAVLERLQPKGVLDELLAPLLDAGEAPADKASARLRQAWQEQLAELGPQRTDAIAINVLLPFTAAYGHATCQFTLSELAVQAFLAYPSEGANQVTAYMRRDVLGPLSGAARGAASEQGLLQVWDRWCHEKVCAVCPLGSRTQNPVSSAHEGPRSAG